MELCRGWNVKHLYPTYSTTQIKKNDKKTPLFSISTYTLQFHSLNNTNSSSLLLLTHAKKKNNNPVVEPTIIEDVQLNDDSINQNDVSIDHDDDDFGDEDHLVDEGYFEDEEMTEKVEVYAGDGVDGGGVLLAGTSWDKEALTIAENVIESFDGDLGIYAFRTLVNGTIQVRIEKLSTKSGSPSMSDIEVFSAAYRARLDEAGLAKTIPENISLEVSSPGVERVIRVPQDFDRFKERAMYVKYITEVEPTGSPSENDGVFRLVSFDLETNSCTWGLADVRINREKAGKGRPMNKKQREWRLTTSFDSIRLARIYSEI